MKLSARNQLKGTITDIKEGLVTSEISIDIGNGKIITSIITKDSIANLGLKVGGQAYAIIKATSVMIAAE